MARILGVICFFSFAHSLIAAPLIIGIAGGTGSGKTTLARELVKRLGEDRAILLSIDNYYHDTSHIPHDDRLQLNFDHPNAVELSLFVADLMQLKMGVSIKQPAYEFSSGKRQVDACIVHPAAFIVVEGIFALALPELAALYDVSVFLTAPADERLIRRFERDSRERGLTHKEIIDQYRMTVRPSHEQFIEPTQERAHLVLSGEDCVDKLVAQVLQKLSL